VSSPTQEYYDSLYDGDVLADFFEKMFMDFGIVLEAPIDQRVWAVCQNTEQHAMLGIGNDGTEYLAE
jgi:hypothetical protein